MRRKRIPAVLLSAGLLMGCLSGCSSFSLGATPEDLYRLPQLPVEYTELNNCIKALIDDGAGYAAPTFGTNIQPVQVTDLDGDGAEEAIAFLRRDGDEKPLKVCIFDRTESGYEQSAVIEGMGTAIYSVAYSDLNGDGWQELLIGWKVGSELQVLTVYGCAGGEPRELMSATYVRYAVADLDGDGRQELTVFRADEENDGTVDYYAWTSGGILERRSSTHLSMTMSELGEGQILCGTLQDGTPALFVSGVEEARRESPQMEITDVLLLNGETLSNLTVSDSTDRSTEIHRFLSLFPMDINEDGVTEIPVPVNTAKEHQSESFRVDWHACAPDGGSIPVLSTYHDLEDGWYLELPKGWAIKTVISKVKAARDTTVVTFAEPKQSGEDREFLRIYVFSGENREMLAARGDRFLLGRRAQLIYAAELLPSSGGTVLSADALREYFHLITGSWTAGTV